MWKISALILCLCIATTTLPAQESKQITCKGKVVDESENPISDIVVKVYSRDRDSQTGKYSHRELVRARTKDDGAFSFTFNVEKDYSRGYVVAIREGLAIGWGNWNSRKDKHEFVIKLTTPSVLAGVVVDEAGKPIAGADVRTSLRIGQSRDRRWIMGGVGFERLAAKTDAEGKFSFPDIPAEAKAAFIVSAPGRASVATFERSARGPRTLPFSPGQKDIKVVLPPEARIEGVVVEKPSGKPARGVRLRARPVRPASGYETKMCVSRDDGRFSVNGLLAKRYKLTLIMPQKQTAEWVCAPVFIATEAGKTAGNVKIELSKGEIVEITVTDETDGEAIPDAYVGLYNTQTREWHSGRTDQEGIARIRLMPGTYRQQNVSKEGYTGQQMQEPVEVTEGKTQRLTVQLKPQPKIRGVVMDQAGKPVSGATVRILPGGGGEDATTGKDGKFEIAARRYAWGGGSRGEEPQLVVVARHKQRNLAVVVEIEDESKPLEVKLRPSATLAGRVTDLDGKPLPKARLMVMLRSRMWGSPIRSGGYLITDSQGRYEIKAIPPTQKYSVTAEADGFGKMELQTELGEQETGRVELENFVLAPANLSISGVVVDDEDKPVAEARVTIYGDRQPHQSAFTDKEGKFVIEQVVADEFRVSAYVNTADGQQHGSVNTKGGDKDVKVVLGQSPGSRPRLPKPRSLLGKPLGDLEQFGLKPASEIAAGKRMLICFWNMEQRPSRHCIRGLAEKADELAKKGVVVVSVHASAVEPDKLKAWTVKYKIPFSAGAVSAGAKKSERTLRKWGVRALPWLILTDKGHIVHAEGFPLGELDATMSEFPSK